MSFACAALQTFSACHVHLGGNKIALFYAGYFVPKSDDFAAEFMPWNQRRMDPSLCPSVPLVYMEIGSADGGDLYFYKDVCPPKSRNFDLADLRPGSGIWLDYGEHRAGHVGPLKRAIVLRQTEYFNIRLHAQCVMQISPGCEGWVPVH